MKLKMIQQLCEPGGFINEDTVSFGESFAMVLDGSTGLRKNVIYGADNDARWFVKTFETYVLEHIHETRPLTEIIKQGIEHVQKALAIKGIYSLDKVDQPSASLIVVRCQDTYIEAFSLGDCTLLIEKSDGAIESVYDDAVSKLDQNVILKMQQLCQAEGLSMTEARTRVQEDLISNRYKKNTPEGYWILGLEQEAIEWGTYQTWHRDDIRKVALLSDGFAEYYEHFSLCQDAQTFLKAIEEQGVRSLYAQLRALQEQDAHCERYPRLKCKDDASILILEIE